MTSQCQFCFHVLYINRIQATSEVWNSIYVAKKKMFYYGTKDQHDTYEGVLISS